MKRLEMCSRRGSRMPPGPPESALGLSNTVVIYVFDFMIDDYYGSIPFGSDNAS